MRVFEKTAIGMARPKKEAAHPGRSGWAARVLEGEKSEELVLKSDSS
jgi:hypothetical protein